jgi:hypothetical protein
VWLAGFSVFTIAIATLFGAVVYQSSTTNSAAAEVVRFEQMGAEMLHPMTTLIGQLVEARSAAVRGAPVDADSLRKALADVAGLDARYESLKTTTRLTELAARWRARSPGRAGARLETFSGWSRWRWNWNGTRRRSHLVHGPI